MRRTLAALVMVALLPGGSGCSFLLVKGPPPIEEQAGPLACTDSFGSPIVDAVFAAAFAATGVHQAMRDDVDAYFEGARRNSVIAAAVGAAALAASSYYGFSRTHACRKAIERAIALPPPGAAKPTAD